MYIYISSKTNTSFSQNHYADFSYNPSFFSYFTLIHTGPHQFVNILDSCRVSNYCLLVFYPAIAALQNAVRHLSMRCYLLQDILYAGTASAICQFFFQVSVCVCSPFDFVFVFLIFVKQTRNVDSYTGLQTFLPMDRDMISSFKSF